MSLLIPSYQGGYARKKSESANPGLWDGLVGAWAPTLGVTGDVLWDQSGFGNDGALTGMDPATDWVMTEKGWALDFNGADDYVSLGACAGQQGSVSAWIRTNSTTVPQVIFSEGIAASGIPFLMFLLYGNPAKLSVWAYGGNNRVRTNYVLSSNTWYHVGVKSNGSDWTLYVDGVEQIPVVSAGSNSGEWFDDVAGDTWSIGILDRSTDYAPFNGQIASVALWDRPITSAEFNQLYVKPHALFIPKPRLVFPGISVSPISNFDTPIVGGNSVKLILLSEQFTTTVKESVDVSGVDATPTDVSWDSVDTPWIGNSDDKLYLQSGQFTSTVKTSEDISGWNTVPYGVSWDGEDTPWCGYGAKLYLQSGQFTSTLKTSQAVSDADDPATGISYDGTDTPWITGGGGDDGTLYLTSGQFTSTIKDSLFINDIDGNPQGISWDGTSTLWCGANNDKVFAQSGQFTSTIRLSVDISSVDTVIRGICTNDLDGRLEDGIYEKSRSNTIAFGQVVSPAGSIYNRSLSNGITLDQGITAGYSLQPSNTIAFGHDVSDIAIYSRTPSNTAAFGQVVSLAGSVYSRSIDNTAAFGQVVSPAGSTYNLSLDNTAAFGQVVSLAGSTYNRSLDNTAAFGQVLSVVYSLSQSNTIVLGHDVSDIAIYSRSLDNTAAFGQVVSPAGSTYNLSPYTDITFGHDVSDIAIYSRSRSNTAAFGQVVSLAGSTYNLSLDNTIIFDHEASTGFTFSISNTIAFSHDIEASRCLENTIVLGHEVANPVVYSRSLSSDVTFGHDPVTVHAHTRSTSSTVSLTQDLDSERIELTGDVYNRSLGSNISFGHSVNSVLILSTGETYYGQALSTVSGLSQDFTVNGVYNRALSSTITFAHSIPKEDPDAYLLDIPRWLKASTSEYFNQIAQANSIPFFLEGTNRDVNDRQKFIEFRLDGPDSAEMSKDYYSFDIDINVLWSFKQDDDNFYVIEDIKGMLIDAMQSICVYKYGDGEQDDNSFVGTLQLKGGEVRVNNFGQVRPDVRLMQGTVEGTFRLVVYLPDLAESPIVPIDLTVDSKIREYPHWIIASANKHFSEIATANNIHFYLEGTHRFTSECQKFIEFRVDGPNVTEVSKDYYRFDVKINILWSFKPGDVDFHEPERMQGILLRAMRDICVHRYGDDGAFVGTLQLRQDKKTPVSISNFSQIRPDVRLMQGTVEGAYSMLHSVN